MSKKIELLVSVLAMPEQKLELLCVTAYNTN